MPPEIPNFVNDEQVSLGGTAQASPGAMGAAGGALAQGAARVSDVMQQFNERYKNAQRAADAANVMADVSQKQSDAQFRWSKTPDRQAALDGYNKEIAALRESTIGKVKDPLLAPMVAREFDSEASMRAIDTGSAAFKLESNKRVADLDSNLLTFADSYASAGSDPVKAKLQDNAMAAIQMSVQGGWLTPEEGQQREKSWGSQVQEVQARNSYNAALQAQDPDHAAQLSADLADPGKFTGLLPEKRVILQQRADQLAYRLETRSAAALAHQDAVADRNQKKAQDHNEAVILGGIFNGKTVDAAQLDQLAVSGQISPSGLEVIHSAITGQSRGADDAGTVVRLWHQIDQGSATPEDVYAAAGKGVASDTAAAMVRAIDAKGGKSNAAERSAFGVLKTAMNGQAIDFGGIKDKVTVLNWAQAQGEWHRRVTLNNEDPTAVLNDMIPRYAGGTKPTWLPSPQLGPVQSFEDLNKTAIATVKAHEAGTIDDAGYARQTALLNQYRLYFRAPPPKPAAAARPQPGGTP